MEFGVCSVATGKEICTCGGYTVLATSSSFQG